MRDDGSVRTDAIDLDLFGARVRVICEDESSLDRLRVELGDHLVDDPAPVGFALQAPTGSRSRLYVLVDRSGLVLARSRRPDECLAVLAEHLGAFAPPPKETSRLRVRAIVNDRGESVLVPFPILAAPPVVERRLERVGHRIVDRVVVDLTADGFVEMSPHPWDALRANGLPMGHASAVARSSIAAMLVPGAPASRIGVIWTLASAAMPGADPRTTLTLASKLADVRLLETDPERSLSVYAALDAAGGNAAG